MVRRRLLGGYRLTLRGTWYMRDRARLHENVGAKLSEYAEVWESGAMTKRERREAQVELVMLAWEKDEAMMAESVAELRAQGFDPLAPDVRASLREKLGHDPFDTFDK